MNPEEHHVSKRLREVWEWKASIYREVAGLPTDRALEEVLTKARSTAKNVDLPRRSPLQATATRKGSR